jgi:predicted RNase H-like HicB family nuclease
VKYVVHARRDGAWWALEIPEVPGALSQARTLEEAPTMAREVIALMLDVPQSEVEVEIVPVPVGLRLKDRR